MSDIRYIDTHCHLNLSQYTTDYREVAKRALAAGVGINNVGCDLASSRRAVEIAEEFADAPVWASIGRHPNDTDEPFDAEEFGRLAASSQKVIAIGETGLDYYRLPEGADHAVLIAEQQRIFLAHLDLAKLRGLPVIIHCRDAHDDLTRLLGEYSDKERGVMHCFTGTLVQAKEYIRLGFLISFTGIITFASQYDEVIKGVPLEKMLIETDAPFLTPTPHRGQRNEPGYVVRVAERVAEITGISVEEVGRITTENARRLFQI